MAAVEPGSNTPTPCVQSPVYGLLIQADQVVNSVKALVNNGITLFPEYKPAKKAQNDDGYNPPVMASLFASLQKPVKTSNKLHSSGLINCKSLRFAVLEDDVGKSQAPPGRSPGADFLLLFLLLYIISLHRSNLPPVVAWYCGRFLPNYAVR
jgi:hypothetical protein